jgi:circadian clock protein KaiB
VISKKNRAEKKSSGKKTPLDSSARFEKLLKDSLVVKHYSLRLYVTGTTPRSIQAVANIRNLCEEYLHGKYNLEVIDIYQQPTEAVDEQIIAAPTLVKTLPKPPRRLIGDLSDRDRVIVGLDLGAGKAGKNTKWSVV